MKWTSATLVFFLFAAGCRMSANSNNAEGVRFFEQGYVQPALERFQLALGADPNNEDAYYNLATVYHRVGRQNSDQRMLRQAEGLYHQCLDFRPDDVDCHRSLAALLVDSGRTESAFTLLKRWAERRPSYAEPRVELARLYEEFGDQQTASRMLNEALNFQPANARAWSALARIREREGRFAQALTNYQQAFNLNRYQPGLADRIVSLQRQITLAQRDSPTVPRTVSAPRSTTR